MTSAGEAVRTSDLIILPLQAGAPNVLSETFAVPVDRAAEHLIRHDDGVGTVFLDISFPSGSITGGPGGPVAGGDSVNVTVQAVAGSYRFSIGPSALELDPRNAPSVTVSFARYSDFGVVSGSSYASEDAFAGALAIWYETTPGFWTMARGSRASGTDEVTAFVDRPGNYLLAAPR